MNSKLPGLEYLISQETTSSETPSPSSCADATEVTTPVASSSSRYLPSYLQSIELPPKPTSSYTSEILQLIHSYGEKKQRLGIDVNESLVGSKQFRNPNIYSKLIEFCGIDEIGSNFPPFMFDPHGFPSEVFSRAILETQIKKEEQKMAHLRQHPRTSISFTKGNDQYDSRPHSSKRLRR
jgi:hypothetical protein